MCQRTRWNGVTRALIRRARLSADTVEKIQCLRYWVKKGLIRTMWQ
ncbi:hypothetical protein Forpi1262_v016574 [Fusarium oxysporum f. sp. raphani]|uniref:HAT C-terminal dimerisation domain-containing protein n=1 Tax=Fusarium oxysporum f. sp. raphani TaxID=96318 RepID=A0A8J5P471_FUSOX|nr:hypothetical protein Forpi1262_v016574 [Fusarium oxysporum f. sp. raphani]